MKSFSQRKGLKPVSEIIQINTINEELRNSLWNFLHESLWSTPRYVDYRGGTPLIYQFGKTLWFDYYKKPIDSMPENGYGVFEYIRSYFFGCKWNEVYDFLEFTIQFYEETNFLTVNISSTFLNQILERELSAYRLISGHFTDITNEQEIDMLELALKDSSFRTVSEHLQRALELYSDRENPDFRNSIKESISAVESMAKILTKESKGTLGDALNAIEKRGLLHASLKEGFRKLYGYTSDESGIRHGMHEKPNLTQADARYFLVSCSAFVNYLKAQINT